MVVFVVCALVGLLSFLTYKEGDSSARFAFAVLLLYTVASPLGGIIRDIGTGDCFGKTEFSPEDYGEDYKETAGRAFADGVRAMICDEFSLKEEDVEVRVFGFDFSSMRSERIRVILSGTAAFADRKGIESFVDRYGIGECDAEIEIG